MVKIIIVNMRKRRPYFLGSVIELLPSCNLFKGLFSCEQSSRYYSRPHLLVERNILWGLRFVGCPDEHHIKSLLDLLRLHPFLGRSPKTLSGESNNGSFLLRGSVAGLPGGE